MDLGLNGKVALVTGSSRGIGKAIAARLLAEGAKVVISGRDASSLNKTLDELENQHSKNRVAAYNGDLTLEEEIRKFIDAGMGRWGKIDIGVANLGSGRGVPFQESTTDEWRRVFETNLFASMEFVRQLIPVMKAQKSGSICLVSSIVAIEAVDAPVPYSSAKIGLLAASKAMARDMASHGIRINVVCPGNIHFPGGTWDTRLKSNAEQVMEYIKARVPMGRFGTPEEIASCVAFLASDAASFVAGACLIADGGQTRSF